MTGVQTCALPIYSDKTLGYDFVIKNTGKETSPVNVYESADEYDGTGNYYDGFLKYKGYVQPEEKDGEYTFSISVKPYSMVTISTMKPDEKEYTDRSQNYALFELPYEDDFEYQTYDEDYLSKRGMAPRYTTDQAGAFEVSSLDGNNVLMQMITYDNKPAEWGNSSDPVTTLLDDRWQNYTVSADVLLDGKKSDDSKTNYAGIGGRYNLAANDYSGYALKLTETGEVMLNKASVKLDSVQIDGFDVKKWHNLKLEIYDNVIKAYVDNVKVLEYEDTDNVVNSGRVSLLSSYYNNCFDNLKITTDSEDYYVTRVDDMDAAIKVSAGSTEEDGNGWYFSTISSFKNYNRTVKIGRASCRERV